jgi:hypothetical protein
MALISHIEYLPDHLYPGESGHAQADSACLAIAIAEQPILILARRYDLTKRLFQAMDNLCYIHYRNHQMSNIE